MESNALKGVYTANMNEELRDKAETSAIESSIVLTDHDEAIQIIGVGGWLYLVIFFIILLMVVLWSIYGSIPLHVEGAGMLISDQGLTTIDADQQGRIEKIAIHVGDSVNKGDVLFYIEQTVLLDKINNQKKRIEEMISNIAQKKLLQDELEKKYQKRIQALNEVLDGQKRLLEKGVVIREKVIETEASITETEIQLENLSLERTKDQHQLNDLIRELNILSTEYKKSATILAPQSGTIVDINEKEGNTIQPGLHLATLEVSAVKNKQLRAIIYVPAIKGNKIKKDMVMKVVPSFIKPQEYGSIIGKVAYVSKYPSTKESMFKVFQNEYIVNALVKEGPQLEVQVILNQDENTFSGYAWTTPKGPDIKLSGGMMCYARAELEAKTPLELIIPKIKEALGIIE